MAFGADIFDPEFRRVAELVFREGDNRQAPYCGVPTLLKAPLRQDAAPRFTDIDVALLGVPLDLGVTNRPGARFGPRAVRNVVVAGILHWRLHLIILLTTFTVFPLLGMALGLIPDSILPQPLYLGLLFLCVLPSTVQSSIAFTSMAGGNLPAAICAASASNIFGMFLTPMLVGLLFSVGGHGGFSWDVLQKILLQLLAPFVLGQILQPWIGDWIRSKKKVLTPVDRGSILMVVYLAFSKAVVEGLWQTFSMRDIAIVVGLDMLLLALVLTFTMRGSSFMGFNKPDQITITFCGSKKSLASGVPMAGVIFGGQSIGEEFKRDAVRQITERGYPVAQVSQRLGVSQHSLDEWKKKFAASNAKGNDEAEEIRRLKKELARVTEERDILKKAAAYFARDAKVISDTIPKARRW